MRPRRLIVLPCLVALLSSCTQWVSFSPGPPGPVEGEVRVTTDAGRTVELTDPFVEGPEYVGTREGMVVRVPLDSIAQFEVKRNNVAGTVVTSVAVTAGVFFGLALLAIYSADWSAF